MDEETRNHIAKLEMEVKELGDRIDNLQGQLFWCKENILLVIDR